MINDSDYVANAQGVVDIRIKNLTILATQSETSKVKLRIQDKKLDRISSVFKGLRARRSTLKYHLSAVFGLGSANFT